MDGPGSPERPPQQDVAEVPQMEPPAAVSPELPGDVVPQPAPLQRDRARELDVLLRVRADLQTGLSLHTSRAFKLLSSEPISCHPGDLTPLGCESPTGH